MTDMKLEKILNGLVGHKITISFISEEGNIRNASGILKEINEEFIHIDVYNLHGKIDKYYLNRRVNILISIVDEGIKK